MLKSIAWRWGNYHPLPRALDIAYKVRLNEWKGRRTVEIELVGVRPAKPSNNHQKSSIQPWSGATPESALSPAQENSVLENTPSTSLQAAREVARNLQQEINSTQTAGGSRATESDTDTKADSPAVFKLPPKLPKLNRDQIHQPQPAKAFTTSLTNSAQPNAETTQPTNTELKVTTNSDPIDDAALDEQISQTLPILFESDSETALHVEFYHSKRRYRGTLERTEHERLLTIENGEGHLLVVQMQQRQGFLYLPEEPAQVIDIAELRYFNLIRAGLNALDVKQKTQLLIKQEELLAEKDRQISTMKEQIELLEEKITQLSSEQQQQFAALKSEVQVQESTILGQEAHIEQLQVHVSSMPMPNAADIKQQVRSAVGDSVWFCLQAASQKDLLAAYKNDQMIHTSTPDANIADYSEAGIRLSAAIEREVLTPFFQSLYPFLLGQSLSQIGGVTLSPASQYTLNMLPPLLAKQWRAVQPGQLSQRNRPDGGVKMVKVESSVKVSEGDRALLAQFFEQWEHPMAECLRDKGRQAASSLDQINKLRNIAAHGDSFLYRWQYELLHQLIAGNKGKGGLLRELFALS